MGCEKMRHFLFGDFFSERTDPLARKTLQEELVKDGVYIYFNEQMDDISCEMSHMLREHPSDNDNVLFVWHQWVKSLIARICYILLVCIQKKICEFS